MNATTPAFAAALAFRDGLPAIAERRKPQAAHTTHVTLFGVEIEAHYDYSHECVVLAHAFITEERGSRGAVAVGPDLIDFLHSSQVTAIEQAIFLQIGEHA